MKNIEIWRFIILFVVQLFLLWWSFQAIYARQDFVELALVLCLLQLTNLNERQRWLNAAFKKYFKNKHFY